ncbi:hypothetical protein HYS30_01020, partial [Candidatus Peregrinibacteria bacterium]|nr:hypothetical protein [Candidatus Peregrinibacteria bacterium]
MGMYFTPPQEQAVLAAGGRRLENGSYQELTSQLRDGEILLGLYWRPQQGFGNAPYLYSAEEFEEFEGQ